MTAHILPNSRTDVAARIASIEQALARQRPQALNPGFMESLDSARSLDSRSQQSPASASEAPVALGTAMAMALREDPLAAEIARPTGAAAIFEVGGAQLTELFDSAGVRHGVDPALLRAVAEVESGFDPSAVSPAGAQGLMQFMPATAAEFGVEPFDPASAIDGAARYLAKEFDRFGDADLAIAAYNAGAGAVRRHGGIPPFPETEAYVEKVRSAWERNR